MSYLWRVDQSPYLPALAPVGRRNLGLAPLVFGLFFLLFSIAPLPVRAGEAIPPYSQDSVDGHLQHIFDRGRLHVGVKTDYPPWGMRNRNGQITGLEADLAHELGLRLGLPVELVAVTTANRLTRLAQGHVDLVIATMADTSIRRQAADLIRPHYYSSGVRLLVPERFTHRNWEEVQGQPVCLTEGAYFNRELMDRYRIEPVIFSGTRDSALALRDGRCVGWAYDDTALAQMLDTPEWEGYKLALPLQMETFWSVAVPRGEKARSLGRFVAHSIAEWHRSGWFLQRQRYWKLAESEFLRQQHALFRSTDGNGDHVCLPDRKGHFPEACLEAAPVASTASPDLPDWATTLRKYGSVDLASLFDGLNRQRLMSGILTTLLLSFVAMAGSLAAGIVFALTEHKRRHALGYALLWQPVRALVTLARLTPPILQLYIVFFGIGGLLASQFGISLSGLLVASLVFSIYAGASNAAILTPTLKRLAIKHQDAGLPALMRMSLERNFDALVGIMVNIVKAAGMASTIAVPEVIAAVHLLISEGGDAGTLMTMLLVFYFCFVLSVMAMLNLVKRWVAP